MTDPRRLVDSPETVFIILHAGAQKAPFYLALNCRIWSRRRHNQRTDQPDVLVLWLLLILKQSVGERCTYRCRFTGSNVAH